jgi:adenosylhomocysteinase
MTFAEMCSRERAFYSWLRALTPSSRVSSLVVTHALPGQVGFLASLSHAAPIAAVLPKARSADQAVVAELTSRYQVDGLDRARFSDPRWLIEYVSRRADGRRVVLADMGGYFAPALGELCSALPGQVAGVVEDTENGHQRYEAAGWLPCAVYSVARSPLKEPEDRRAGEAIVFSAEALIREFGAVLRGLTACVLGYGNLGAAIAGALEARGTTVLVVDTDPVRQVLAAASGNGSADLDDALAAADLVFSATGRRALGMKHLPLLRDGAMLAAATSWDDEFDLGGLSDPGSGYQVEEPAPGVRHVRSERRTSFYLLGNGGALNFLHASAIGPAIHLVKAELIAATALLATEPHECGMHAVPAASRAAIAAAWLDTLASPHQLSHAHV